MSGDADEVGVRILQKQEAADITCLPIKLTDNSLATIQGTYAHPEIQKKMDIFFCQKAS